MPNRKRILVAAATAALIAAGTATAAAITHTITLHSGKCVTVSKTKVCAAASKPVTVKVAGPPSTTITVTATVTTPPPPPATAFGDGTYRIGPDIQPGTYKEITPSSSCYWARLSGFSGTLDDILANSLGDLSIVTIAPSDAGFQSQDCGNWTKIG